MNDREYMARVRAIEGRLYRVAQSILWRQADSIMCYPDDGSTCGNPVNLENRTIREESWLPGYEGKILTHMSVRTDAGNAIILSECAQEPLQRMLEEAESVLREKLEMLEGIGSTPLKWLTRTVVTFDQDRNDILAVTLWFEGSEVTTTFRWVLEEGIYKMTLPESVGEG